MLTTHSSLPTQAVAMARTDSQEMHTLLTCAEPVQLQQADPAMLKSMAAVGVLGVKTRPRIPLISLSSLSAAARPSFLFFLAFLLGSPATTTPTKL